MALIFGSGEPVARVRRGLDVKGKVNLGLDEIVVPVANTIDLTAAPIRRSPVRWWATGLVVAVPAEVGRFRIFHQNAVDQLIDQIWIGSANAGLWFVGGGPAGASGGVPARTSEIVDATAGGTVTRLVGITSLVDSTPPSSISQLLTRFFVPAAESILYPVELVLPAMPDPNGPITNAPCMTIEAAAVNDTWHITVSGLYHDALPLSFKT